jgi:Lrp/AsnC family leucine-responsive transcriptional regulator
MLTLENPVLAVKSLGFESQPISRGKPAMTLDRYDRILLDALMENGRASFAQLARLVNLSAPAVAERVAKLEASGVITGYGAKVDMNKVGLPIQCVIELRMNNHGNQQAYDELWKIPELVQCQRVTGESCVIMQAAVGSMPQLEDLINRIAQFGFSKTSIVLSTTVDRALPLNHLETNVVKIRADA